MDKEKQTKTKTKTKIKTKNRKTERQTDKREKGVYSKPPTSHPAIHPAIHPSRPSVRDVCVSRRAESREQRATYIHTLHTSQAVPAYELKSDQIVAPFSSLHRNGTGWIPLTPRNRGPSCFTFLNFPRKKRGGVQMKTWCVAFFQARARWIDRCRGCHLWRWVGMGWDVCM